MTSTFNTPPCPSEIDFLSFVNPFNLSPSELFKSWGFSLGGEVENLDYINDNLYYPRNNLDDSLPSEGTFQMVLQNTLENATHRVCEFFVTTDRQCDASYSPYYPTDFKVELVAEK